MTSDQKIPPALIGLLGEIVPAYYTHAEIDSLFLASGCPDQVPTGSKLAKVTAWLRVVNNECGSPLEIVGKIIGEFMDAVPPDEKEFYPWEQKPDESVVKEWHKPRERIKNALSNNGLTYQTGGIIVGSNISVASKTLGVRIKERGLETLEIEYKRAYENIDKDPPAAVTAACAILEATFKTYLEEHGVKIKGNETLQPLWAMVADQLSLRPGTLEDINLKKIVSGLHSIVDGLCAIRNKQGSAHGHSGANQTAEKRYRILPKHARLAVNASHTVAIFVIDAWKS